MGFSLQCVHRLEEQVSGKYQRIYWNQQQISKNLLEPITKKNMSYFWLFPSNEAEASWCLRSTCNNESQIELFCQSGQINLESQGDGTQPPSLLQPPELGSVTMSVTVWGADSPPPPQKKTASYNCVKQHTVSRTISFAQDFTVANC